MPPTGIDLPQLPIAALRARLDEALGRGAGTIVVFTCAHAPVPSIGAEAGVAPIEAECIAMIPPAFVEYALRAGVGGVVLAGCREGDCEHRLGDRWALERIGRQRDPVLRQVVPRARVRVALAGSDASHVLATIRSLRRHSVDGRQGGPDGRE